MNPKFQPKLYFQLDANGKRYLEACGPIDFEPGDLSAVVTSIEIQDGQGVTKRFDVDIHVGACDTMWEVDLTNTNKIQALHAGPNAAGVGTATVTTRVGDAAHTPSHIVQQQKQWTGTFELIDPPAFLASRTIPGAAGAVQRQALSRPRVGREEQE
jgi:hypothetical protein